MPAGSAEPVARGTCTQKTAVRKHVSPVYRFIAVVMTLSKRSRKGVGKPRAGRPEEHADLSVLLTIIYGLENRTTQKVSPNPSSCSENQQEQRELHWHLLQPPHAPSCRWLALPWVYQRTPLAEG